MEDAATEMQETREQCSFKPEDLDHRRGPFPALAAGVLFGGGQIILGNLTHNQSNCKVLQKPLCHPLFVHISNFANGAFTTWFPKIYDYYHETLGSLYAWNENLDCLVPDSVWAMMSFNFGPATWCY
jgi:hypothetical protein